MAGPFEMRLAEFAKLAGENADAAVRAVVLEVGSRLVIRSPVDTGRFRANWRYSLGSAAPGLVGGIGPAVVGGLADLPAQAAGRVHWLQNNLPYARRLEHGWSKQAPNGMVGLTVIEFAGIVDQAAAEANR